MCSVIWCTVSLIVMAEEVLFVETSTYEHDYKLPDKRFYTKALASKNEPNLYNNIPAGMKLRAVYSADESNPLLDVPPKRYAEDEIQRVLDRRPISLLSKTLGNVTLRELGPEKREDFLSCTYRTTYNELAGIVKDKIFEPPSAEWNDHDEKRLQQTFSTLVKPIMEIEIPTKVIEKWAAAQPRCQRSDNWFYKTKRDVLRNNPFPDYPQALLACVGKNRLKPQFDPGRELPGYTGYRKHYLDFSKNIDDLLDTGNEFCDTHGVSWKMAQDLPKYVARKREK